MSGIRGMRRWQVREFGSGLLTALEQPAA